MIPGPQQTPENLLLAEVVVHSAIVFNGMGLDILKPFNAIVNHPGDLKVNCYLLIISLILILIIPLFSKECFPSNNA